MKATEREIYLLLCLMLLAYAATLLDIAGVI